MIHIDSDLKSDLKKKIEDMENQVIHKYVQMSKSKFKYLEPLENAYGFSLISSVSSMLVPKVSIDVAQNSSNDLYVSGVNISSCNIKTKEDVQIFTKIMAEVNLAVTSFMPEFISEMNKLYANDTYEQLKIKLYGR